MTSDAFLVFVLIGFLANVVLVPIVAGGKGRSAFGWMLIGFVFSPLLALIALAALPARGVDLE